VTWPNEVELIPTGAIAFYVNGKEIFSVSGGITPNSNTEVAGVVDGSNFVSGNNTVKVVYPGDPTFLSSTMTVNLSVGSASPSGATLYGTVTDRTTHQPLAGVSVKLCAGCATLATTGADGVYSLPLRESRSLMPDTGVSIVKNRT
jgi:hypothetical protein